MLMYCSWNQNKQATSGGFVAVKCTWNVKEMCRNFCEFETIFGNEIKSGYSELVNSFIWSEISTACYRTI